MPDKLIYLDNAATTLKKPACVIEAITNALTSFGGPGRGGHPASIAATMALFKCREEITNLFNARSPECVSLTCNATESLNIAISGLLKPGDHAITTAASHNSLLRPLYKKRDEEGVELDIIDIKETGELDIDEVECAFKKNTKLLAVTHSSNLTGNIYDIDALSSLAHKHGAKIVIDAAQTTGICNIDMQKSNIDVLCITGHKSLYGPQGTGAIIVDPSTHIPPFKVGGSGIRSFDEHHPDFMPDSLEAGTLNAHGFAGLAAGIQYVKENGVEKIFEHTSKCIEAFENSICDLDNIVIYGKDFKDSKRCAISAINIAGLDSSDVADKLAFDYSICTRAGAHCAPLMHKALNTADGGIVRFSFCLSTTFEEVEAAANAIKKIASTHS